MQKPLFTGLVLVLASTSYAGITTITFDTTPVLSPTQIPGAWYTDRYAPAVFESALFDGDNRLKQGLRQPDSQANRTGGFASDFYNYQGRKFDTPYNTSGTFVSADLYLDSTWTNGVRAGLWATASNSNLTYPIIEYVVGADGGTFTGFRWWQSGLGWTQSALTIAPDDAWYTLKIELTDSDINFYVNSTLLGTVGNLGAHSFENIILQGHNQGAAGQYDIYWDNVTIAVPVPGAALVCATGLGLLGWFRRRVA